MSEQLFNRNAREDRPCPNCKNLVTIKASDLIDGKVIICPHCGFQMDTKEVSKGLKELEDKIKKIFKL